MVAAPPAALADAIKRGEVVLWVGSGLSAMAGLPLWAQTRDLLIDEIADHGTRPSSELDAFRNWNPRDAGSILLNDRFLPAVQMARFFLKTFCCDDIAPAHRLLADIGIRHVVTTNWDTLLEVALDEVLHEPPPDRPWQRRCFASFTQQDDIHLAAAQRDDLSAWVFHLHGIFYRYDTVVWKEQDYDVIEHNPTLQRFLKDLIEHRTILFVGFGLSDEDLDFALRSARLTRETTHRVHYAILPETYGTLELAREKNISPILYGVDGRAAEPHRAGLEAVLSEIVESVR